MLVDVDYFKQFNDHYGHQVGDQCLQQVASLLAEVLRREDDLAARYGGEEFALLLPCTTLQGAMQIAEQVRTSLRALGIPTTNPGSRGGSVAASGWRPWCRISITPLPSSSRKRMRRSIRPSIMAGIVSK